MKVHVKSRVFTLLLSAVMAGSLCTGIEVRAEEMEQEEEVTEQNEGLTGLTTEQNDLAALTEETADSEEKGTALMPTAEEPSTDEDSVEEEVEEVEAPSEDMRRGVTGEVISGTWGVLEWSLNNNILTIGGPGEGYEAYIPDDIDEFSRDDITKIIINEGIKGAFIHDCTNLKSIVFPESVTEISCQGCSSLESIVIPKSVTKIGDFAFERCSSLGSIVIPNKVTKIPFAAFQECSALKSVAIPESVSEIDEFAFAGCGALESITIPSKVGEIGNSAFIACSSLKKVVISSKTKYTRIGSTAFGKCSSLVDVTLPNGEVGIGTGAFEQCSSLSSIVIPKGVTDIGNYAFHTCNNLKNITIKNKSCTIWGDGDTISSTATIYGYKDSTAQDYARKYNRKFVELKEPVVKATKITISGPSHKIAAGKKVALKATVSPSNATNKAVTWKSGNTRYATVSSKGIVTMKKAGKGKTVTITATAKDGSGKKAVYKIKFMKGAVKKVAISGKSRRTVQAGKAVTLKASVKATVKSSKDVNKALKWTTSNKKYATVTSKGKVRTLKAGKGKKVKITAAATDGSGKKATVTITLK